MKSVGRWSSLLAAFGVLVSLAVLPPAAAQAAAVGNAKAYSLISQVNGKGAIARWNPCAGPIDYRVNLARSPKNSLPEVKQAFAAVAKATGLTFRYAGATTVVPMGKKGYPAKYPAGTEIVVAWATPGVQTSMLAKGNGAAGVGGPTYFSSYTATGAEAWSISQGSVVLSAPVSKQMARGFTAKPYGTTGQLLMHEIGHAVGLGHPAITDPAEIMSPILTTKKAVWGAGDLAGLRTVGKSAGCLYARRN